MGVIPFLAACHACVLMLYCIVTIVCYVCSFEWQKVLSLYQSYCCIIIRTAVNDIITDCYRLHDARNDDDQYAKSLAYQIPEDYFGHVRSCRV